MFSIQETRRMGTRRSTRNGIKYLDEVLRSDLIDCGVMTKYDHKWG